MAYLRFPSTADAALPRAEESLRLSDVLGNHLGPDVVLDFGPERELVGIEILLEDDDEDDDDE